MDGDQAENLFSFAHFCYMTGQISDAADIAKRGIQSLQYNYSEKGRTFFFLFCALSTSCHIRSGEDEKAIQMWDRLTNLVAPITALEIFNNAVRIFINMSCHCSQIFLIQINRVLGMNWVIFGVKVVIEKVDLKFSVIFVVHLHSFSKIYKLCMKPKYTMQSNGKVLRVITYRCIWNKVFNQEWTK